MRKLLVAVIIVLCPTLSVAQQAQPPFVQFTVNQQDYQAIQNWLGEQPAKFSIPVLTWLDGLERKAQEEAKKAATPAPAPETKK